MTQHKYGLAGLGALALATACASAPTQQYTQTESSVRAAEEVGAEKHPASALHLQLAKDQIRVAKKLIDEDGRNEMKEARLILMRAESDAELAIAYAKTQEARYEAKRAWSEVRGLQQEAGEVSEEGMLSQ